MNYARYIDTVTSRYLGQLCRIPTQACEKPQRLFASGKLVSLLEIIGAMDRFNADDLSGLSYNLGQFYILRTHLINGLL